MATRRKPWSVRDADHIPDGTRVLVTGWGETGPDAEAIRASSAGFAVIVGVGLPSGPLTGHVVRRHWDGSYDVKVEGSRLTILAERWQVAPVDGRVVGMGSERFARRAL